MQMHGINTENLSVCNTSVEIEGMIACCLGWRSYLRRIATISGAYENHILIPASLANQYIQICLVYNVKVVSDCISLITQTGFKTYCCRCASDEGVWGKYTYNATHSYSRQYLECSAASHCRLILGERASVAQKDGAGCISEAVWNVRGRENTHMPADNGTTSR
jgi:hypothetical protein